MFPQAQSVADVQRACHSIPSLVEQLDEHRATAGLSHSVSAAALSALSHVHIATLASSHLQAQY